HPRSGDRESARRRAAGVPGRLAAGFTRPRAARRGRDQDGGVRGRPPAQLPGRLGGGRAGGGGARGGGAAPNRPAKAKPAGNGRATRSGPSKNAVRRVAELEREVERAEAS